MRIRMGMRWAVLGATVLLGLIAAPIASADEVTFAGFTNGCFGAGCTPGTTSGAPSVSLLGLTYNSSTFNGTSSGGFLGLGATSGVPNVDNLGSFTLAGTPANYNGQTFRLRTTFTAPPGITGGNSRLFTANLTGTVSANDVGGVLIDFDDTPTTFTFSFVNAQGMTVSGSFSFTVLRTAVIAGGTVPLTGMFTGANQATATTSVILRSMSASRVRDDVVVRWQTASEADLRGFNVYRQRNGKLVKLNRALIPTVVRTRDHGHAYSWRARGAARGAATYRLQAVTLTGSRSWLGAVAVR